MEPRELLGGFVRDYAKTVVTVEAHPHMRDSLHASIHPCKHASAIVSIFRQLRSSPRSPDEPDQFRGSDLDLDPTHQYLQVFLKIIQGMINLEYDYSSELHL